ncbi:MAG: tetratricopeptide repeat protein [Candidatus Desulfatibia sp.]|uniref:tetratricopeptide repeat protein n=1 Tax=Candidatus Desulfatibia sp. TaxID=3101189 RepID=UPI002F34EE48
MKNILLKLTIGFMVIFFFYGCSVLPRPGPTATDKQDGVTGDIYEFENQYYYFTEAQFYRKKGSLDKAIQYMQKAVDKDPESSYLQKEIALLYLQQKNNLKALDIIKQLLKKDSGYIPALIIHGRINQRLKHIDDAKKAYEKVIAVDPRQQNIYLILGGIYMEESDLDKALKIYEQLVQNFPGSYAGHFFMGKIYATQGKMLEAENKFFKTLEIMPGLDGPRFELLKLYKTQGKDQKVLQLYKEILGKNPRNIAAAMERGYYYYKKGMEKDAAEIFKNLGERSLTENKVVRTVVRIYLDPKKYDAAITVLKGMLKGAPDSSNLHYVIGIAFDGKKNIKMAVKHFKMVMPNSRFYKESAVHVAFIYQEQGKTREAIDFLNDVIKEISNDAELMLYMGSFYEETKEFEKAEAILKKGLEIDSENTKLHFRLGVVYDKWGRKDDSIAKMKTVISFDPKNANALNYLGYTYADMGQNLDEAERLIKEALKHKPDDGYITDSLGWVYYKKGLFSEAVTLLKKAVSLEPDDPIILEHLGDAYLKVNQNKKALKFYKRSLKNKGDDNDKAALEKKIEALNGNE